MFRSGGSEYEINGSPARLSDIQDLLSEAGLGQDMHVLVGQGQLDAVLHATSQQRRDMIEQAAGVVKYRRRQEKTSRKLESVASNLTRLSDLASELDSQLQPLSDQAESAATARQLQGRIRQLESVLLARQLGVLRAEQEQAATAEAQGTRRAEGLSEQLRAAREAAEAHREGQLRLTAEVTAAQAAVSSLRESAARTRSVQSIAAERVRTYRVELTEATAAARAGYERALEVLEERREESERATEQYAGFEERYAEALSRVERAAEAVGRCERSTGEAAHRRARAQEQLDAARAEAVEATRAYAAASERAATLREALGQSLGEDPAGDAASNVVAPGEDEFDPETGELLEHAEPADSGAPAAGALRVLNAVQIDPEYARAAACALSALATAALTESSAAPGRSHLRGEAPSHERVPAASLPEPHAERLAELGVRAALEVVEPLNEEAAALSGIDGETLRVVVAALRERLAGTLFAPSPEAAEAALRLLTAEYPETPEDSNDSENLESSESDTSTPEGETAGRDVFWRVFDARGVEYTRYSLLYPAEGVSALELAAAHREAERAVALTRASLDDAEAAVARARAESESAVEDERVAAKAAGVAAAEHARARAEAESLKDSALNVQNERARHVERLAAAERAVSEAESAYRAARTREDEYLAGTGEQAPAATVERRARRLLEVLSAEVTEREGQLRELSAELEKTRESALAVDEEVRDLQSSHAAALTLLARTQTEAARVQERLQALAERVRLQTGVSLEQLGEDYSEQLPVDISENIESFAGAPENTAEKEATENTESAAKNVENADGAENPEDEPSEREIPTAVVRARLEATRAELTALGAINPLALEEYEALSERHAYLNQQIDDLKATRRDLNTVMDEVSSHIAEVFTAALEDINTHYRRIFATLFPGGEGHLELDDPADPLNAGVEIHARPAGKKVKRLSLLSGGERSLASLALLIAIYMSRPSPFYALDEVEAALDDRNLSRLLQVLGELGERSQLIVVTHQKRTMQMAQTLYGVSMREGVSAVLSQDMEELRELL